ncbi:MAG: hypothetical protein PHE55_07870 [Methylococcaceae bacterium]|nr:hypothetical protein [Methylococcaceae bacterium]
MAKSDFVPTADNDFLAWLEHLAANAGSHQAELGLSPTALSGLNAAIADFRVKLTANTQAQSVARQATEAKKASRRAAEGAGRAIARQSKVATGYTDALGALLQIVGPEDSTDYASLKPDLTATDQGGGNVVLGFSKLRTDGVNIYVFDEATGQFRFLARDTQPPYVDNRPLAVPGKPELRRYKAIYVLGDEEIGLFSDEVVVNCTP